MGGGGDRGGDEVVVLQAEALQEKTRRERELNCRFSCNVIIFQNYEKKRIPS